MTLSSVLARSFCSCANRSSNRSLVCWPPKGGPPNFVPRRTILALPCVPQKRREKNPSVAACFPREIMAPLVNNKRANLFSFSVLMHSVPNLLLDPGPVVQEFRLREREELARLLFPSSAPASPEQQLGDSCVIIRLYVSLCGRREYLWPRRHLEHAGPEPQDPVDPEGLAAVTPSSLGIDLLLYPLVCPRYQCRWCLGDPSLP
jgi:hypothetical protein